MEVFASYLLTKLIINFQDTVETKCPINNGIEDNELLLLYCCAYDDQRHNLLSADNELLHLHSIVDLTAQTFICE